MKKLLIVLIYAVLVPVNLAHGDVSELRLIKADRTGTHDVTSPTVGISSDKPNPTNGPFTVTMVFSESVSGFSLEGMSATNATLSNFERPSSLVYKALVTPIADGVVTVNVHSGVAQDNDGNENIGQQLVTNFDGTPPTVIVTAPSPTIVRSFTATFSFSEPVNGFSKGGITVTNGQAINFTAVSNTVYTSDITSSSLGPVTIKVNAIAAADAANNGNITGQTVVNYVSVPSDIILSPSSVLENSGAGAEVGTLSSADADDGDSHTYRLVSGEGDVDNGTFTITGTQVSANVDFDREAKSSYSIRVETTDSYGYSFEKALTIDISNVAEAIMRVVGDLNISPTPVDGLTNFEVTIYNDGDLDLVISSITYPDAYSGPSSAFTIGAGNNEVITFAFTPVEIRTYAGDITITSNGGIAVLSVTADGGIVTAIEDGAKNLETVKVYPNPAEGFLNIDLSNFNGSELPQISIYDFRGVIHYDKRAPTDQVVKVDVSDFSNGIYLILLNDGIKVVSKKVMIRR